MRTRDAGFTIIELLTSIAIIVVLAAVIAPRMTNMVSDARSAGYTAVMRSFKSAVSMAHSKWIAIKVSGGGSTIDLNGTTVEMTPSGWPDLDSGIGGQESAQDLYSTLMALPLPSNWATGEDFGAKTADFSYDAMSFRYDATTGQVSDL